MKERDSIESRYPNYINKIIENNIIKDISIVATVAIEPHNLYTQDTQDNTIHSRENNIMILQV